MAGMSRRAFVRTTCGAMLAAPFLGLPLACSRKDGPPEGGGGMEGFELHRFELEVNADLVAKPAEFGERLAEGRVRCVLCHKQCILVEGQRGLCSVRANVGGQLKLLAADRAYSMFIAPLAGLPVSTAALLEDTPILIHGSCGCSQDCKFCYSWEVAKGKPDTAPSRPATPAKMVELAEAHGCKMVHFTENEPMMAYEYTRDIVRACRRAGLFTLMASNGTASPKAYREIGREVDSINFGFKGFSDAFYRDYCDGDLAAIRKNVGDAGPHVNLPSVSYVLIPKHTDSPEMLAAFADWVGEVFGERVPVILFSLMPARELSKSPLMTHEGLRSARDLVRSRGLHYTTVHDYLDPSKSDHELTCHACGGVVVARNESGSVVRHLNDGRCVHCDVQVLSRPVTHVDPASLG
jgi:pyruvate formate lyase activating enzyme